MSVSTLGYLTFSTQDIPAWKAFGTQILGLMLNEDISNADSLFFRMDDHPSRLMIKKSERDRLAAVGWEIFDKAAYETSINRLRAAGVIVVRGDEAGAAARNVTEYAVTADMAGNPLEVFHTRTGLSDDFVSPLGIEKFVTGRLGMGHVVLPSPDIDENHDFYAQVMGFGDSDYLNLPPFAEGRPDTKFRFMHAGNARHHSLALGNFAVPTGIVNFLLEVSSIDEVGACLDRVEADSYPLMASLGRHCNDNMLSFYVLGPGGISIEFGCEGKQIDWRNFKRTHSSVGALWGHNYARYAVPGGLGVSIDIIDE